MSQQVPPVSTSETWAKVAINSCQVFTTHCEVCIGRSTWDFLQDFYLRVETAENYARSLEKDLYEAQTTAHQCHNTLAQCETSLSASWEILNEERLSHQASQEALMFESERQEETIALLERILKEAILSSEAADILGSRRTTAPKVAVCQATPRLDEKTLTGSGISTSVGQQSESTPLLLPSFKALVPALEVFYLNGLHSFKFHLFLSCLFCRKLQSRRDEAGLSWCADCPGTLQEELQPLHQQVQKSLCFEEILETGRHMRKCILSISLWHVLAEHLNFALEAKL
jgi:hypothetical protein